MQASVSLQKMFSYSAILFGIIFLTATAVAVVVLVIYFSSRKKNVKPEVTQKKPVVTPKQPKADKSQIKQQYQARLDELEAMCRNGSIGNRGAYQKLSSIMRHFVYEMTGKNVLNSTLEDLAHEDVPALYNLINECYIPEFSTKTTYDIYESINRARKVVVEWN